MRHFEGFVGDGCHTSEVGLITLVLEDSLLAQLNSMLFFELTNESLQEFLLVFELINLGLHFNSDSLLHAAFVHAIARNLRKQFHVTHSAESKTLLIKGLAEILTTLLVSTLHSISLPNFEDLPDVVSVSPLVNPAVNNCVSAVSLRFTDTCNLFLLLVHRVHVGQLLSPIIFRFSNLDSS